MKNSRHFGEMISPVDVRRESIKNLNNLKMKVAVEL